ncbi:antibiotic biosynthesis monooxygenase family protein [Novosphingobium lentum]|uniref:antibiotic biosynthesis monooxygenase family protein n=1 Tax=Novosphingobium lentum TaxID=145287 RepID=UPI00082DEBD9|nr:antibiotic biosynthesis monooxygenase family protein [Novosphingobium lentum]
MILERAEINVKDGQEAAFASAMDTRGLAILRAAAGCHSAVLGRGVENPGKFILLLEWDSVDAHVALTKTPAFDEFKALVGPFFGGPSNMEHFDMG